MTKKLIILVALTAAALGAVLILNPFAPAPEKVIQEMQLKMAELKTFHSRSTLNLNVNTLAGESFDLSLVANSDNDKTDPQNLKQTGDFNVTVGTEGVQFYLSGENIIIGDSSYLKLTTIPALPMIEPMLQMLGINISSLKNQWIKLDQESIKELTGENWTAEMEEELSSAQEKNEKTIQELQTLFLSGNFYSVKQELAAEKINGQKAYHYIVGLEKEGTKALLLEAIKVLAENEGETFNPDEEELASFSANFDEFFTKIGGLDADLWIGQKDKLLYKFDLTKEISSDQLDGSITEEGTVIINMIMEFSNFNQPLNITAPEDAKPLNEILGQSAGGFFDPLMGARQAAKDARVIADMNQLRAMAQIIEIDNDQSYSKVNCADDSDIRMICDDIVVYSINQEEPTIYQSKNAYCAYIELSEGEFYCIDSQLNASETSDNPGQTGFCDGKTFVCPPEII
ncbi:MAG: hypothetical protein ABH919_02870 [bacterium]